MFIGKSLTNIRILNELSRSQLAEKLDITEQAVWQYENGYVSPKLEVVNKMKTLFKVKSSYFFRADLLESNQSENICIERIAYRSESINSAIKTQSEFVHVKFLDAFIKKVATKIKYPQNELLNLRIKVLEYLNSNQNIDRDIQIRHIAKMSREHLKLPSENNKNLLFHLERTGVFIFEKSIGDTIDAYSLWSEDDIPYIVLGNIKKSAVRRNFDLAHELGHLLLHYKTEFNMLDKQTYKIKEDEAHLFAAEFLMPVEEFREDVLKITKISNPDAYIELKEKWLVSLQAMAMRARNLDLITHQQFRYFYMSINKKGYRKNEPLDSDIPIERPMKIRSILQLLFEKKIISLEHLTDELKVDISFLTIITGIEEDFFKKYANIEQQSFSINDLKIIK
ncbi:putative Zn peptidase [Schinkia azotoformans MEV2011]|uniref:Putative Zn peptidase n=1 Tax=Schinkia azotoformans MEV2011 TaxID=1348973 RepID=A0A072NM20_SCHAZ|nr:XRE family transcriptional regulator [Schinkia azotoformans]KEF38699.1 putative Zn peptidase [Schinkia azotoformans MEV2011]MEC1696877.1 XRE family transcriptional regulator [Schinkia azotoformans]MEC1717848.1 XRE family transcriptional regulator [Schinkia azotoformans]MEC1727216.1 XRE family transcriptional regulator [Schinkia azotoformans]MEC1739697.1 XRE family transcriptional regulator [Schinkia azotoformans]